MVLNIARPDDLLEEVLFKITWILPSIFIFFFHLYYFQELKNYNQSLQNQLDESSKKSEE